VILQAGKSHFTSKWLVTATYFDEEQRERERLNQIESLISRSAQPEKAQFETTKKEIEANLQKLKEKPKRIITLKGPRPQIEWMDKLILSLKTKKEEKK
jgi:hypothetical protein